MKTIGYTKTFGDVKAGDTIGVELPNNSAKLVKVVSIAKDKVSDRVRHIRLDDGTEFKTFICENFECVLDRGKGVYSYFADLDNFDRYLSKEMNELKKAMVTIKAVRKELSSIPHKD